MEATKGLIFNMVAPINITSSELKTSAKLKAQTPFLIVQEINRI